MGYVFDGIDEFDSIDTNLIIIRNGLNLKYLDFLLCIEMLDQVGTDTFTQVCFSGNLQAQPRVFKGFRTSQSFLWIDTN